MITLIVLGYLLEYWFIVIPLFLVFVFIVWYIGNFTL